VKCYRILEKTGNVVGVKAVDKDTEVMMISSDGIIIQIPCREVSVLGRVTSGVKVMNLKDGATIASITKVKNSSETKDEEETEEQTKEE
jgi:DNA gyrase subunit A